MAEKQSAFVLPVEAATSMDYQTFPGFPGRYFPGKPTLVDLPPSEAEALVKELGLPLEKVAASKAKPEEPLDAIAFVNADKLKPGESRPRLPAAAMVKSATPEGAELSEGEAGLSPLPVEALEETAPETGSAG